MRAAIRQGALPAPRDRASGGRNLPRRITVKGFGAEAPASARANGHVSAADTGSEMDDEGSEIGRAHGRRIAKRRLERRKAESAPKAAKKGLLLLMVACTLACPTPLSTKDLLSPRHWDEVWWTWRSRMKSSDPHADWGGEMAAVSALDGKSDFCWYFSVDVELHDVLGDKTLMRPCLACC